MKIFRSIAAIAIVSLFSVTAFAQTISTEFNTSDGFITGPTNGDAAAAGAFNDVTLTNGAFDVTFSGGQQQQGFDGPSYNNGPAAFLFVNTGPGAAVFTGASGNTITGGANNGDSNGLISFGGAGASTVSFFAADRANGAATTLNVLGTDGTTLLDSILVPSGSVSDNPFTLDASTLGGAIGSISVDLPGPNANPAYVVAIDSFSATAASAVPEPSSLTAMLSALALVALRRRRQ